jgi:hypothetical protein
VENHVVFPSSLENISVEGCMKGLYRSEKRLELTVDIQTGHKLV